MRQATMVLQIGPATTDERQNVSVRRVSGEYAERGGARRESFETGFCGGESNQGMSQVVHSPLSKLERSSTETCRRSERKIGRWRLWRQLGIAIGIEFLQLVTCRTRGSRWRHWKTV